MDSNNTEDDGLDDYGIMRVSSPARNQKQLNSAAANKMLQSSDKGGKNSSVERNNSLDRVEGGGSELRMTVREPSTVQLMRDEEDP